MLAEPVTAATSPRVPSPWDELLRGSTPSSTSVSPPPSTFEVSSPLPELSDSELSGRIPRLAPEVEVGNVEYKLKLLDPTPARFARLVTQLKWRLLEGEGQCYYEIGVADSGLLIGLTKQEMERSLETLEEMAGEIGASVIVVKEVEVPDALVQLAQQTVQRLSRKGVLDGLGMDEGSPTAESWLLNASSTERRDKREEHSPSPHDDLFNGACAIASFELAASSEDLSTTITLPPKYAALEQDLAFFDTIPSPKPVEPELSDDTILFSFDAEPVTFDPYPATILSSTSTSETLSLSSTGGAESNLPDYLLDLSIASVYKPRPGRRRTHGHHLAGGKLDKRQAKWEKQRAATEGRAMLRTLPSPIVGVEGPTKAEKRRAARDKRRDERRLALASDTDIVREPDYPIAEIENGVEQLTAGLVMGLEGLHVGIASPLPAVETRHKSPVQEGDGHMYSRLSDGQERAPAREPRLIVEALVVRKLSVEEAYGPGNFGFEGLLVAE